MSKSWRDKLYEAAPLPRPKSMEAFRDEICYWIFCNWQDDLLSGSHLRDMESWEEMDAEDREMFDDTVNQVLAFAIAKQVWNSEEAVDEWMEREYSTPFDDEIAAMIQADKIAVRKKLH